MKSVRLFPVLPPEDFRVSIILMSFKFFATQPFNDREGSIFTHPDKLFSVLSLTEPVTPSQGLDKHSHAESTPSTLVQAAINTKRLLPARKEEQEAFPGIESSV